MDALHSPWESFPAMNETSLLAPAPSSRGAAKSFADSGVRRLTLTDFRSYAALDLRVDAQLVVLTGDNGAGKTNLLEALSLLAPGRGLRRAELAECARKDGRGGFAVSAELETCLGGVQLGTGIEPHTDAPAQRKYRIDRAPAASIRAFCDHVRVVWLTPAMDGLFSGPAGIPRPPGAVHRRGSCRPRERPRTRLARPQPAPGGGILRRPRLARRDRGRNRPARRRHSRRADRNRSAPLRAYH